VGSDCVHVGPLVFVAEEIYTRKEIHAAIGGQPQGGISTPALYPVILIFTGEGGQSHGYGFDGWKSKDRFDYTGEGQPSRGNMSFIRGNRAIRDHIDNNERILLFENLKKRKTGQGNVKFVAEMEYIGHRIEQRDTTGIPREVIVFELKPLSS
jgi:5-methylcytosine-specific restriction enzyme A